MIKFCIIALQSMKQQSITPFQQFTAFACSKLSIDVENNNNNKFGSNK